MYALNNAPSQIDKLITKYAMTSFINFIWEIPVSFIIFLSIIFLILFKTVFFFILHNLCLIHNIII